MASPALSPAAEVFVPHLGWFLHEPDDEVALYLDEGWFEYREQAFLWLYLREGDTVVDCGAHFGLYSVLSGRAGGPRICVHALEPNPESAALVRENLNRNGIGNAMVHTLAAFSRDGEVQFHISRPGRAAYSSLVPEDSVARSILVRTETLDTFCGRETPGRIAFVKIDVEGAEIEVLQGAAQSIAGDRFGIVMLEATELNLRRSGAGTRTLFDVIEASGLRTYRLDEDSMSLVPRHFDGPIWFDNLFLAKDAGPANARLKGAGPERLRIAREVIRRGRASDRLYRRVEFARTTAMRMRELLSSRYLRFGWRSRLVRKPAWITEYLK